MIKRYYLETNALLKISKHLDSDWARENTFTSMHSVAELLTDLNDNVFGSKQAAVRRILEFNIDIDWRQPQRILLDAFGMQATYKISPTDVLEIMKELINAPSYEFFFSKMETQDIYQFLQAYDAGYNSYFPGEIEEKRQEFRQEYSFGEGNVHFSSYLLYLDSRSEDFSPRFREEFISAAALKVAEDISNSNLNNYRKDSAMLTFRAYNGSIDLFLLVSSIYSFEKVASNGQVARNDFSDVHHLCYIDDDVAIISDDNMLKTSMDRYDTEKCMNTASFMELLHDGRPLSNA
jgi:hypothetical protein